MLPLPSWTQQTGGLKIKVIEGENALNRVKSRFATQPIVEIRDESDKPVEGADVVFRLPASGPSGVFYPWMRIQAVKTDGLGRAAAHDLSPNEELGRFNISVSATHGTKTATATISQTNTNSGATSSGSRKKLYIVLGVVAVGAIAGGIAASQSGSGSAATPPNPVTIAPGPISVGGPR